jgi:hypothetical protein
MIWEISGDVIAGGIGGFFFSGLILGLLVGYRMCKNREGRRALEILEAEIKKPKREDTGMALVNALEEKSIKDTEKVDVGFIKEWIKKEYKKSGGT